MQDWLSKFLHRKHRRVCVSLRRTYRQISSASVDQLWLKVSDLTDFSWHPLFKSTNVPLGLVPKPGLIFQAVSRFWPVPIHIFVERVSPVSQSRYRQAAGPALRTVCGRLPPPPG